MAPLVRGEVRVPRPVSPRQLSRPRSLTAPSLCQFLPALPLVSNARQSHPLEREGESLPCGTSERLDCVTLIRHPERLSWLWSFSAELVVVAVNPAKDVLLVFESRLKETLLLQRKSL